MSRFKDYILSLNEVKLNIKDKIQYNGFSNSSNLPGLGGTYLYLSINDFDFGIYIGSNDKFSVSIIPNISADWRKLSSKDKENFKKYFGDDLRFKDVKDLMSFLKKINNYDKIIEDLLYNTKENLPSDLKNVLMKNIKMNAFEKKLHNADDFDRVQLLIKKFKPTFSEDSSRIYIENGSDDIGYIKLDRSYWYLEGKVQDKRLAMIMSKKGEILFDIRNKFRTKENILKRIQTSKILPIKYQKLFYAWFNNKLS